MRTLAAVIFTTVGAALGGIVGNLVSAKIQEHIASFPEWGQWLLIGGIAVVGAALGLIGSLLLSRRESALPAASPNPVTPPGRFGERFGAERYTLLFALRTAEGAFAFQELVEGGPPAWNVVVGRQHFGGKSNPELGLRLQMAADSLASEGLLSASASLSGRIYRLNPEGFAYTRDDSNFKQPPKYLPDRTEAAPAPQPVASALTKAERRVLCAIHKYGDNSVGVHEELPGTVQGLRALTIGPETLGSELDGTFEEGARALQTLEERKLIERTANFKGDESFQLTKMGRDMAKANCPKLRVQII